MATDAKTVMDNAIARTLATLAAAAVVLYAALAGLRTMVDPDMWWQMASGRYFVTSGHIARTEVFSYTAPGAPWTYPVAGGVLFHWIYTLGGLKLLSLLSPLVGAAIALLLVRLGRPGTLPSNVRIWMAALAVDVIAVATLVRANMFTALLGTVFLAILWKNYEGEKRPLWILPLLMLLWANVHPGYIFGIALLFAFALRQPRRVMPWALLALAATLINPWGWSIYSWLPSVLSILPLPHAIRSLGGQLRPDTVNGFIGELSRQPISPIVIWEGLRNLEGFWWLMLFDAAAVVSGILRKRFFGVFLLAAAASAGLATHRLQGLFAITSVIVAPDLLPESFRISRRVPPRVRNFAMALAAVLLIAFAGYRSYALATDRYYIAEGGLEDFGVGASPWVSERAARFIEDHNLPRQIYNEYTAGGFMAWRMYPRYPIFIDGRLDPYGEKLFFVDLDLMERAATSAAWRETIARWNISTIVASTDRFVGYRLSLRSFCTSPDFALAYLDDQDAIFVVKSKLNTPALDCQSAKVGMPPVDAPAARRYRALANSVRLYDYLGRLDEASAAAEQALAQHPEDPSMHSERGLIARKRGNYALAEAELRRALQLDPESSFWSILGQFLTEQQRYDEAMDCFRHAAALAAWPYQSWDAVAATALAAGRPADALAAADRALATSPFKDAAAKLGYGFLAQALCNRGIALVSLFRVPEAIATFESASRIVPARSLLEENLALRLGDAYYQGDRFADARRELEKAKLVADQLSEDGDPPNAGIKNQLHHLETVLSLKK